MFRIPRRIWIALLLIGALLAIVLLAASLPNVDLQPGKAFYLPDATNNTAASFDLNGLIPGEMNFLETLLLILLLLSPLYFIFVLLNKEERRKTLLQILILSLALAVIYSTLNKPPEPDEVSQEPQTLEPVQGGESSAATLQQFTPDPPRWMTFSASAGIIALLLGAGFVAWRLLRRQPDDLDRIGDEAEDALRNLRAGADLKDTIMRCYLEMGEIARTTHGIERARATTPREFERRLTAAGLPAEYVLRLTRLFETVRYGAVVAGSREEQEAVDCLSAIARYAGKTA